MSQVELNGELFTLERFRPNAEEEALQAWEAADEYLLQQVNNSPFNSAWLIASPPPE